MQLILRLVILAVMAFSCSALADTQSSDDMSPWFTGPLLAPSGTTFPKGQIGFQPYVFYTDDYGVYNHLWKRENTRDTHTVNPEMAIFVGLTDSTELQFTLPYFVNTRNGQSSRGFGDFGIQFGYQVLREKAHTWIPDIKLTLAETFPTGRFENLSPSLNGTDAFGSGSYQTSVGLTFQKMVHFSGQHYLRGRWNFTYTMPTKVYVHGLNAYGGVANTDGIWNLGNHFSTDLAFEYTITRHWVPAIDFLYTASPKDHFSGNPGTVLGLPVPVSEVSTNSFSIAPAIEYNFNGNLGIIAGVWFGVDGRNTPEFASYVFSLDASI